jgi:PAS domain S-box-containing protein
VIYLLLTGVLISSLTVRVGYEENYPLSFSNDNGAPSGLYIELFNEIAAGENWAPEYIPGEWADLTQMLLQGEIDVLTCMAVTPARKEIFLFPEQSVHSSWSILLVKQESAVNSITDIAGGTVAVLENDIHSSSFIEILEKLDIPFEALVCATFDESMLAVLEGRALCTPVPRTVMLSPDFSYNLVPQGIVWNPTVLSFAGNREHSVDVITAIDANLQQMKQEDKSVYYNLVSKWLAGTSRERPSSWYYYAVFSLLGVFIVYVIVTNMKLSRSIKTSRHALAFSRSLADIAIAASEADDLNDLCRRVAGILREVLDTDNFYIAIYNPENDSFFLPVFVDEVEERAEILSDPRSFTHYVFHTGKSMMLDEKEIRRMIQDPDCPVWVEDGIISKQYIAVPLDAGSRHIGVIAFQSYEETGKFSTEDLQFVTSISSQIGGAVERMRAREDLKNSRSKQQMLLDADPSAIFLLGESGKIVDCNRKACEFAGIDSASLHGRMLRDFLQSENRNNLDPIKNLSPGESSHFSCSFLRDNGAAISVEGIVNSFTEGKQLFHFVTVFDATEKRLLQREAIRNERIESIGLLAGGIAHDFNNILTGIMGSLSLLRHGVESGEKQMELIDSAEKATFRARELTGQLLTFSKGGAPVRTTVQAEALLREVAVFVLRGSSVLLNLTVEDGTWDLNVDSQQFSQVFQNIITNARQAMNNSGKLDIDVINTETSRGRFVQITFKDDGPGVSPHAMENLFDPYFTTREGGHGLGLATSFSIVQRHGGTITVSNGDYGGAVFSVTAPASENSKSPGTDYIQVCPSLARGRILLLEDDRFVAETAVIMLDALGYSTDVVTEGNAAFEMYRYAMGKEDFYKAAIMDLTIPGGMGGADAVKLVLGIDPDAVVIVSSGYSGNDIMANYRDYGFSGVLSKPYTVRELADALQCAREGCSS